MTADLNPELRLVGGHPALDLVNSVAPRLPGGGQHVEFLTGPVELLAWARRAGVVDDDEAAAVEAAWRSGPGGGMPAWRAATDIREALYTALIVRLEGPRAGAGDAEAAAALERLMLHWSVAVSRSVLVPSGDAAAVRLRTGTVPASMVPDRLAHLAVELLREADIRRLRICPLAEGGCGWIFLDRSRNGSRRWCAMEDCGSQVKARRLTARRGADRATGK